jgi:5-oxopent-3-ene-1,2,5-tricarboxylate decarboxylase/2-hydroxyhepta-2,4-diene-1,7-dioate isomerase
MPHIMIEYSGNLAAVDWPQVLQALHSAAAEMPELPLSGLRTRARACDHVLIADGSPRNAFVHVVLRMGHGRADEAKQRIGDRLFGTLCDSLKHLFDERPVSVSFEIQEIHPVFNFRKSNLAAHMQKVA